MTTGETLDRLRLTRTEGVGPITFRRLLARYASAAEAIDALPGLARAGGKPAPPTVPSRADAERELERLAKLGGRMLFLDTPDYPPLLALLPDAPPALAVLGDPAVLSVRAVGLVGARNASANGQRMAEALATDLAQAGLAVISGLARGIDAAAHAGALHSGRTIAAVAGGLDVPYPPEHADLQARIAANGAVVAEAPLGTAPQNRHFPRRNRIIAGLSLGLVVVEAALRSGSLITARLAQDAHRELFAVPGSPLDPRCHGSNDLIRQGAHLTESAADVLANLPEHPSRRGLGRDPLFAGSGLAEEILPLDPWDEDGGAPDEDLDAAQQAVVGLLGPSPVPVDDLVRRCHFSPPAVISVLMQLSVAGRVEFLPGDRVCLMADARMP
jgi:DNA processing protein